ALRDVRANREIVVDRAVGSLGYIATALKYGRMLLTDTVGWPFVAFAALGLALDFRARPMRTLYLLAFPIPFMLFIASTFPASRYLIPLVPFIGVFVGVAIEWVRRWNVAAAWVALVALALLPLESSLKTDLFIRQTDTRTLAAQYIEANIPAG